MNLFDSSALIALLKGEPGAELVEEELTSPSACASPNWSEVAQKALAAGRDWSAARTFLLDFGLRVESVTAADAERAAELWLPGSGLSLADRLCLATGERLGATVWTADAAWGATDRVRQVR